ncbi:hypothetical protein Tco_1448137 [Tanacetum coccineum]
MWLRINLISSRRRCGGNGGRGGSMTGRGGGWLVKRSIVSNEGCGGGGLAVCSGSKLMDKGEDYLEGCDGAGGREVNDGGVVLGLFKRCFEEISSEVIGESGRDTIGLDGGAVW